MKKHFRRIMGRNCIREVLRLAPQQIIEVYTSHKNEDEELYRDLQKQNIPVKQVSKRELSQFVDSESHQSFVAAVKEKDSPNLHQFFQEGRERSLVLMLDSIYDPQNLGAIIRAAECFGVDFVIFSKNRGANITPVATKTSAGATEIVPLLKVSNLTDTMKQFQENGYWSVAAEMREGSQSLYQFSFPEKTLLVMGSEGKGIQPLLSKKCDFHLAIPMMGSIDSLNVSQATAVLLNYYQSQQSQ